jgi:hypothetical protein
MATIVTGMWDLAWQMARSIALSDGKRLGPTTDGYSAAERAMPLADREYTIELVSACVAAIGKATPAFRP